MKYVNKTPQFFCGSKDKNPSHSIKLFYDMGKIKGYN